MVIYVILLFYAFLLAFRGVAITPMCLATCLPFSALQIGTFLLAFRLYTECPNTTHEFLGDSVTQRKKEAEDAQARGENHVFWVVLGGVCTGCPLF